MGTSISNFRTFQRMFSVGISPLPNACRDCVPCTKALALVCSGCNNPGRSCTCDVHFSPRRGCPPGCACGNCACGTPNFEKPNSARPSLAREMEKDCCSGSLCVCVALAEDCACDNDAADCVLKGNEASSASASASASVCVCDANCASGCCENECSCGTACKCGATSPCASVCKVDASTSCVCDAE